MNTITIKENSYTTVFDRVCDSPPSSEDIALVLDALQKHNFKVLECSIDIIQGDKHQKVTKGFSTADTFISYLKNLCEKGVKYGVVMYLHY